jgi:hypothetical protein
MSTSVLSRLLPIVLLAASASLLSAQEAGGPVTIQKVTADLIDNPGGSGGGGTPIGKWLMVDVTYDVAAERKFLPDLQFKIYIEVQDLAIPTDKEGPAAALTGDQTYVNIPDGKDYHAIFYVHPFTLQRFGGDNAAREYKVASGKDIHIEAYNDGQEIASKDKNTEQDPNWFSSLKKINGFVIPKDQSPWPWDNSRVPPVKQHSGGGQ